MSKHIKLHTSEMGNLVYVNYAAIKLFQEEPGELLNLLKGAHSPSKICNNVNIKKDSSHRLIPF